MAKQKKVPRKSAVSQQRGSLQGGYQPASEPPNWFIAGRSNTKAGVQIDSKTALRIAAVHCAVTMLSNSVGAMPLHVYKRLSSGGKERVVDDPVAFAFTRKPNNFMIPIEFKSLIMNHVLLRGDFFAHIVVTQGGGVQLIPMNPDRVKVGIDNKYELVYSYEDPNTSQPIPFVQDEIFHVKGLMSDGLRGMSVIKAGVEGLSRAAAADDQASEFYGNNSVPTGILEYPQVLKKEDVERLRTSWELQHKGSGNRHRVAVLEQGLKWQQLAISHQDSQFIESRQFEIEDIARWFNIPPHKLKHLLRSTFSNIEHQSKEYYEDSVLPYTKRIQETVTAKFLSTSPGAELFAEFLFDSLLITDTLTRYQAHNLAITGGWKNRNEVRAIENLNPEAGLDGFLEPLNMTPVNGNDPSKGVPSEPKRSLLDEKTEKAFVRMFESAFGKVRSRETKKWADAAKRGVDSKDIEEFYSKLHKFIPEAMETISLTLGEFISADEKQVRSVVAKFADSYRDDVMKDAREGALPDVSERVVQLIDEIKSLAFEGRGK